MLKKVLYYVILDLFPLEFLPVIPKIMLQLAGPPRGGGGGNWGILPWAQKSIYFNRTVKYSIKAVTTYSLPWGLGPSSSLGWHNRVRLI